MTNDLPIPDPSGSLDPPKRHPPTALATSDELPDPVSGPVRWLPRPRTGGLVGLVERALDVLDTIGDRVRDVLQR